MIKPSTIMFIMYLLINLYASHQTKGFILFYERHDYVSQKFQSGIAIKYTACATISNVIYRNFMLMF